MVPPDIPETDKPEAVVPLRDETVSVEKQRVERSRVRVSTRVAERETLVRETLEHEEALVTRVPVGREIDAYPGIRQEGDVTVIPLVEEILVVERRLVLREELHIRKSRRTVDVEQPVILRSEQAAVERIATPRPHPNTEPEE
ncbi:YsnF/AvaK domain-containing protein [Azospirillum picis]|uniref:Uncharacterized protein (TIGR02271 family) n=1 Tax=Azospirillum picis TaxID=488438 RepID=A0ABU0MEU2_9PROT|nr:YsnF/AvaK domain-containing protein [Azospirillum picis]MBP2298119.1 uncharacterized protein (TIGR02271 family) [Azospirillum picis]MDQ0531957.1 uncharacterized protein (TIGR02271 family) [Azospirillum picis]